MLKTEPRLYQEKILATAAKGNTLVVLPTGMGKTLIAIMLGMVRQKAGKILFLSPTKPLAEQHAKTIYDNTGIMPLVICGNTPFEKRKNMWKSEWIVATPQTVERDIMKGVDLGEFSLVVFDEAHRATGNYAYVHIARYYVEKAKDPLILAMTASPGSSSEKISEIVNNLFIKHIEIRSEDDPDVKPYIQKKLVNWISVNLPKSYEESVSRVKDVLRVYLKALKTMGYIQSADLSRVRKSELLKIQGFTAGDFDATSALAAALKTFHALEMLETQSTRAYSGYLKKLEEDTTKAAREIRMALPPVPEEEHPKMEKLVKVLKDNPRPAIIFSNYREQVDFIVERLREEGVSVEKFVGQKNGMTQKEQKTAVQVFRDGGHDVMVSTSVGEEGIDIPAVATIIFYEPVSSAIRYIQRRGRLRKGGSVFILMTRNSKEEGFYYASRAKEKKMVSLLRSFTPRVKTRTQSTLQGYGSEKGIIVDDHELAVAGFLENPQIKRLEIADFILSDRVAVERKTTADFVSSIVDGRLFDQVSKLKETYEKPILILEGKEIFNQRGVHPNAIRGALASLAVDWGIPIIATKDEEETARMLEAIAKREWGAGHAPSIKVPKARTLREQQEFIVSSLPGINLTLAKRLLGTFGSPIKVFDSSLYELMGVEGIGEGKASEIRKALDKKYGEEE